MKNSYIRQIIIVIMLMMAPKIAAQTVQTTEKQRTQEKTSTVAVKDLNPHGIDDAKEKQQIGKTSTSRMRDHFIDANGDGICDNREQGLGFRRGQMGMGKQTGKHQQGMHK